MRHYRIVGMAVLLAGTGLCPFGARPALAQSERTVSFSISGQPLRSAIQAIAMAAGESVVAPAELLDNLTAPELRGRHSVRQALDIVLAGSGLRARRVGSTFIIERIPTGEPATVADAATAGEVIVTGTRIRGAPVAAPVIRLSGEAMRDAGQTDLGAATRTIPQNFAGGQNPGVGANVPTASGVNVGSASTINLRGLGSDATLTLLNGHRLAYNGSRQGVDVSSIPIAMVDRIEIVPDGASALYGSDAVAGVANIILKRDYDRLRVSADVARATDGGAFEQRYGILAGGRWSGGGIVAAYEYGSNSAIVSDQRSYAAIRPNVTIYPALNRHAVTLAGHQALGGGFEFAMDGLFNRRSSLASFPLNFPGDLSVSRTEQISSSRSFAVAPSLTWRTGSGWRIALSGVWGDEKVRLQSDSYTGATRSSSAFVCYCNKGASAELAADGALFALPGGSARLATGVGYRYNLLDAFRAVGNVNNVRQSQDSYYAYGELNLPLVGPDQRVDGINRLNLSAALRYERYPGIDAVAVPKLGIIWAPSPDLDLKASWGRSFRAPTLLQQYQVRSAILYPATSLGGTGLPVGATALLVSGGNPGLVPERARSWTAGVAVHPRAAPGLSVQIAYFLTRYTDRIVTPIAFQTQALSNALYADLVTRAPGAALVTATIAGAAQLINVSGRALDPAAVVAIVDNSNLNAGRQRISGVDLIADYRHALGSGQLGLSGNLSYLKSDQQLTPGAPVVRAGTLFNPPHWRGRGAVTWSRGAVTLYGAGNYTGGVDDVRSVPAVRVGSVATFDVTARFAPTQGLLRGLELSARLLNIFNAKPDRIASTLYFDSAFDSTNHSPVGRLIGFGIATTW